MCSNNPNINLLPCPFCGSRSVYLQEEHFSDFDLFQVQCDGCTATGSECPSEKEAVNKWNNLPGRASQGG